MDLVSLRIQEASESTGENRVWYAGGALMTTLCNVSGSIEGVIGSSLSVALRIDCELLQERYSLPLGEIGRERPRGTGDHPGTTYSV